MLDTPSKKTLWAFILPRLPPEHRDHVIRIVDLPKRDILGKCQRLLFTIQQRQGGRRNPDRRSKVTRCYDIVMHCTFRVVLSRLRIVRFRNVMLVAESRNLQRNLKQVQKSFILWLMLMSWGDDVLQISWVIPGLCVAAAVTKVARVPSFIRQVSFCEQVDSVWCCAQQEKPAIGDPATEIELKKCIRQAVCERFPFKSAQKAKFMTCDSCSQTEKCRRLQMVQLRVWRFQAPPQLQLRTTTGRSASSCTTC